MNIDRDKIVEDLGQVFDFLKAIDDPYRDSVALAAGLISGEIQEAPGAARLLTLEEVRGWKGFLWLEVNGTFEVSTDSQRITRAVMSECYDGLVILYLHPDNTETAATAVKYGEDWRCWETRPTEEEMAGRPWGDEE